MLRRIRPNSRQAHGAAIDDAREALLVRGRRVAQSIARASRSGTMRAIYYLDRPRLDQIQLQILVDNDTAQRFNTLAAAKGLLGRRNDPGEKHYHIRTDRLKLAQVLVPELKAVELDPHWLDIVLVSKQPGRNARFTIPANGGKVWPKPVAA